jgi:hypothetical protein
MYHECCVRTNRRRTHPTIREEMNNFFKYGSIACGVFLFCKALYNGDHGEAFIALIAVYWMDSFFELKEKHDKFKKEAGEIASEAKDLITLYREKNKKIDEFLEDITIITDKD